MCYGVTATIRTAMIIDICTLPLSLHMPTALFAGKEPGCPLGYIAHIDLTDKPCEVLGSRSGAAAERLANGWAHYTRSRRHPDGFAHNSWRLQFATDRDASDFEEKAVKANAENNANTVKVV